MDRSAGKFRSWASKLSAQRSLSITPKLSTEANDPGTAEAEAASTTAALPMDQVAHVQYSVIEGQHASEIDYDKRLIVPSESPRAQYPPIYRIPTELLLQIFRYDDPAVHERLRLTHVCQRWREIAIESGSLWTSINIIPPAASDKVFHNFISLLDLQLERTQNLALDVVWHVRGYGRRAGIIMKHIRQNSPFHRWKSLTLSLVSMYETFEGNFPNLESLVVLPVYYGHQVLQAINLTTTSKLRTLDISLSGTRDQDVGPLYGSMLNRITRLVLTDTTIEENVVRLPSFPANIIEIEAGRRTKHPFPYAQTYKLTHGIFREDHVVDLQRLTTLIITSSFAVQKNCQLVLPSLRRMVCANITLGHNAVLDAPMLEALEFRDDVNFISDFTRSRFSYIKDILGHPGYFLSPTKSLSLDLPLPADLVVTMISRYSHLEKLTLRFHADVTVWRVTAALVGNARETGVVCPLLTELRLRFTREYGQIHDVEWWKDRATQILRGRRGLAVVLRIYRAWDEGETFTLVA